MKLALALGALALAAAGGVAYVRLAPSDAARWHVDPLTAVKPSSPNAWLLRPQGGDAQAPVYKVSAADLAADFDRFVLARPRVTRLAGSVQELWITYVVRSRLIGFPDYVSVRFIPLSPDQATLAIFSRARFGYGDGGVNRQRVESWLKRFQPSSSAGGNKG
ncbi:MAG: DUF1499 domain-containing protein [Paracoccaceae bacterium]|nr:DUF1499 domain-containing protein [Paracoccaceae bacterium]